MPFFVYDISRARRNRWPFCALAWPAFLVWAAACSLSGPLREDAKAQNYRIPPLPARWSSEKVETGADHAWLTQDTGAIFALNSTCNRYPDASLESLTRQLLAPIGDLEILAQEKRPMDGRESLATRARGRIDGVPVESELIVYRKDDCIFDFTLSSRDSIKAQDRAETESFAAAFHYAGGAKP